MAASRGGGAAAVTRGRGRKGRSLTVRALNCLRKVELTHTQRRRRQRRAKREDRRLRRTRSPQTEDRRVDPKTVSEQTETGFQ